MDGSAQPVEEQKAPLRPFPLYFLRLGTVGFGGPIALASRMESELVQERGWIQREDYLEGLAFAQLSPGPLAAQLAMYLGYVRAGVLGATAVAVAFVAPSFLMVVAISVLYVRYDGLWVEGQSVADGESSAGGAEEDLNGLRDAGGWVGGEVDDIGNAVVVEVGDDA